MHLLTYEGLPKGALIQNLQGGIFLSVYLVFEATKEHCSSYLFLKVEIEYDLGPVSSFEGNYLMKTKESKKKEIEKKNGSASKSTIQASTRN